MDVDYQAYLDSDEWKHKRLEVIRRAGHRCQLCNSEGPFHVHHRSYARLKTPEEIEDLICLCHRCHYKTSEIMGHVKKPLANKHKGKKSKRWRKMRSDKHEARRKLLEESEQTTHEFRAIFARTGGQL